MQPVRISMYTGIINNIYCTYSTALLDAVLRPTYNNNFTTYVLAVCSGERFMHSSVTRDENCKFPLGFHSMKEVTNWNEWFLFIANDWNVFIFTCNWYKYSTWGPLSISMYTRGETFISRRMNTTRNLLQSLCYNSMTDEHLCSRDILWMVQTVHLQANSRNCKEFVAAAYTYQKHALYCMQRWCAIPGVKMRFHVRPLPLTHLGHGATWNKEIIFTYFPQFRKQGEEQRSVSFQGKDGRTSALPTLRIREFQ